MYDYREIHITIFSIIFCILSQNHEYSLLCILSPNKIIHYPIQSFIAKNCVLSDENEKQIPYEKNINLAESTLISEIDNTELIPILFS